MTFIPFDTWEEAQAIEMKLQADAAKLVTDAQRKMLDGQEHWAFAIEGIQQRDELLAIIHIRSYAQIIEGAYPEDAGIWFGDDGKPHGLFLPCDSWDGHYNRPGDEGDVHDWHVARLMEISKETFDKMYEAKCNMPLLSKDPEIMRLFLTYIATLGHIS